MTACSSYNTAKPPTDRSRIKSPWEPKYCLSISDRLTFRLVKLPSPSQLPSHLRNHLPRQITNITRDLLVPISTAILIKYDKKRSSYIRAIFYINCHYNFNPCGMFEKMIMTSFTQILNQDLEQGTLMAAVDSRNKVPKKREF